MTVNDVDLVTQPNADILGFTILPADAESRLTFQHFNNRDLVTRIVAPHNSDARKSDSDDWPPPLIFDVAYGCAVLKTWGLHAFKDFARQRTRRIYYDNGNNHSDGNGAGAGGAGDGSGGGGGAGDGSGSGGGAGPSGDDQDENCLGQKTDHALRAARQAARQAGDSVGQLASSTEDSEAPDIADMVLGLWMHNVRRLQPQVHAMEAGQTKEKVGKWLDSME